MQEYQRGYADGKRAAESESAFAPDAEGVEHNAGYAAGYAAAFNEGVNQADQRKRAQEDAQLTARANALAATRQISPIGRIVWGKQWPEKAQEIGGLAEGEIGSLGRSYLYEPDKHVPKRRLAAVERELYDLENPERTFIVAVLDALVEAIVLPQHAGDFIAAVTRQQTSFAMENWNRCTLQDLRTIASILPIGPENYSRVEWKWFHKDYRRRASLFYGHGPAL